MNWKGWDSWCWKLFQAQEMAWRKEGSQDWEREITCQVTSIQLCCLASAEDIAYQVGAPPISHGFHIPTLSWAALAEADMYPDITPMPLSVQICIFIGNSHLDQQQTEHPLYSTSLACQAWAVCGICHWAPGAGLSLLGLCCPLWVNPSAASCCCSAPGFLSSSCSNITYRAMQPNPIGHKRPPLIDKGPPSLLGSA